MSQSNPKICFRDTTMIKQVANVVLHILDKYAKNNDNSDDEEVDIIQDKYDSGNYYTTKWIETYCNIYATMLNIDKRFLMLPYVDLKLFTGLSLKQMVHVVKNYNSKLCFDSCQFEANERVNNYENKLLKLCKDIDKDLYKNINELIEDEHLNKLEKLNGIMNVIKDIQKDIPPIIIQDGLQSMLQNNPMLKIYKTCLKICEQTFRETLFDNV